MKASLLTLAALTTVSAADDTTSMDNTMWYIEGFKGLYDGFYRDFYKKAIG